MRPWAFLYLLPLIFFAAALLSSGPAAGVLHAAELILSETFSDLDEAALPKGWSALELPRKKKRTSYTIDNDGENFFLKAESEVAASALYRNVSADPREYQLLSWRWKVENVIEKGNERRKDGDDYAARVYVTFEYEPEKASAYDRLRHTLAKTVFQIDPPGNALCYVWANRLARDSSVPNPFTEKVMMVAVESGPGLARNWIAEERNVLEDYRKLFNAEPPKISGIVIMTDTDNTKGRAVAYYDDIALKRPIRR